MVLEAWENAEKITYPVVWEEAKEASNVVDYDIHNEITTDTSAVFNANNDTTTGMATVIPWVNAPKLIAETSIVWSTGWWVKIVEISDYSSVDERQPIVDKVLWWEFIMVKCKYPPYSNLINLFFTPCVYVANQSVRFCALHAWVAWVRLNCWISGTTVTSIWWAYWQWNTNG